MFAIALRLFLCLSLILAGAGPGFASPVPHPAAETALQQPASMTPAGDDLRLPCHGQGEEDAPEAASPAQSAAVPADSAMATHSDGCCPDAACECALLQLAQGILAPSPLPGASGQGAAVFADRAPARPTPRLHHPLRPPIG